MKALSATLVFYTFLGAVVIPIIAQQSDAERVRIEQLKAKAEKGDAGAQYQLGEALLADVRSFYSLKPVDNDSTAPIVQEAVRWLVKSAEQTNAAAQISLGRLYMHGTQIPKDCSKAQKWLQIAADCGNPEAQVWLGAFYTQCMTNDQEAVKWMSKAVAQKYAPAYSGLASRYNDTNSPLHNPTLARSYIEKGAEAGDANSQIQLGWELLQAAGTSPDKSNGIQWIERGLSSLDKETNALLHFRAEPYADAWLDGKLLPRNASNAVYWIDKGLRGDLSQARLWASFYDDNWQSAEKYYLLLAEKGTADARTRLGDFYSFKVRDDSEAAKWYRKAAQEGEAYAQINLAVMYENGEGVIKSSTEAVKWYRMAAEQGNAGAQCGLAGMYGKGQGVVKDDAEAVKWYRKAAEQGNATAQNNLGAKYATGEGVAKDELEAYKWFLLAGARGNEFAKKNIPLSERRLTAEQRAEGQRQAREFKPRTAPLPDSPLSRAEVAELRPEFSGTGFFITEDGYFITNQHVTGDGATIRILTAVGTLSAKVVKVDKANDLALLKTEGKFAALPVVASRGVKLGGTVATVGFPNIGLQGFAPKLAKGEIASLSGAQDDARYFQISVPVQPGNSGGALVDERGNVVGVVAAKLSARAALSTSGALPENVNYAVKSSYLLSFLESVPEVAAKLKEPNTKERKFEDVVKDAEQAAVLVLVY